MSVSGEGIEAPRHRGIEQKRRGRKEEENIRRLRRLRRFFERIFKRKVGKRRGFTQITRRHGDRQKNKKKAGKRAQIMRVTRIFYEDCYEKKRRGNGRRLRGLVEEDMKRVGLGSRLRWSDEGRWK